MSSARSDHHARVFGTPWKGVHGTVIASARHYGRHWHATPAREAGGDLAAVRDRLADGSGRRHSPRSRA